MFTPTRALPLLLIALGLVACKPKPQDELQGTPPKEDRIAEAAKTYERARPEEISQERVDAWIRECFKSTSLGMMSHDVVNPTRNVLISVAYVPGAAFQIGAQPAAAVDAAAMRDCLIQNIEDKKGNGVITRNKKWTVGSGFMVITDDTGKNHKIMSRPRIDGNMDALVLDGEVNKALGDIERCYDRVTKEDALASGAMLTTFSVDAYGAPTNVHVMNTLPPSATFNSCVHSAVSAMRFPTREETIKVREMIVLVPD